MARDPLAMLLRLRSVTLDSARRALAQRLAEEAAAAAHADALDTEISSETARYLGQPEQTRGLDNFAAWRAKGQRAERDAGARVQESAAATAEARATVNAARADARALEAALGRAEERRRLIASRAEQRALDEAGALGKREEGWSG